MNNEALAWFRFDLVYIYTYVSEETDVLQSLKKKEKYNMVSREAVF